MVSYGVILGKFSLFDSYLRTNLRLFLLSQVVDVTQLIQEALNFVLSQVLLAEESAALVLVVRHAGLCEGVVPLIPSVESILPRVFCNLTLPKWLD